QRRERLERDLALVRREHFDVVLAAHVPDDDAIGAPVEVRAAEALEGLDAELRELRRHGRVDVLVGAAHVVPRGLEQPGERSHARPGDADKMYFHLGRHSVEPGLNWVANFFTSIAKVTLKS